MCPFMPSVAPLNEDPFAALGLSPGVVGVLFPFVQLSLLRLPRF
jgi:hypothetical protein